MEQHVARVHVAHDDSVPTKILGRWRQASKARAKQHKLVTMADVEHETRDGGWRSEEIVVVEVEDPTRTSVRSDSLVKDVHVPVHGIPRLAEASQEGRSLGVTGRWSVCTSAIAVVSRVESARTTCLGWIEGVPQAANESSVHPVQIAEAAFVVGHDKEGDVGIRLLVDRVEHFAEKVWPARGPRQNKDLRAV